VQAHLTAKSMELSKMFRDVRLAQSSFGKIQGDVHLKSRGNTTAQMLASASGDVLLLMGQG
jgi:AsmA family protein